MNETGNRSLLSRLTGGRRRRADHVVAKGVGPGDNDSLADGAVTRLSGANLEDAYRNLLLENQVLVESNQRLHDRLAQQELSGVESPATRELIRAQRDALTERSHRLRELEYENKDLKRKQHRLFQENRRLAASLAKHMEDIQPLLQREEHSRRELAEAQEKLRRKSSELIALTDRYYQLEARTRPQPPPSTAANSDF